MTDSASARIGQDPDEDPVGIDDSDDTGLRLGRRPSHDDEHVLAFTHEQRLDRQQMVDLVDRRVAGEASFGRSIHDSGRIGVGVRREVTIRPSIGGC